MEKRLLTGLKAISMGSAWAGPYIGRVLAEYGAEVFRIDFPERILTGRGNPELLEIRHQKLLEEGLSKEDISNSAKPSPNYTGNYQASNYGIGMNLRNERGQEIYKRLVKFTDVVIDGWSPRVMADFGLGYSDLKQIKPDIIYLSIPAMGMTGCEKDTRGWGTAIEYMSGLTSTRGYPDEEPHRAANFILDGVSSAHILTVLFAALNYRMETGKGQHIDVSQAECGTSIMGEAIMDYALNRRITGPAGNQHPVYAPHNCYRCQGEDKWVTIAVTSEEEWHNLCRAMGHQEWIGNSRFDDQANRRQNQAELDNLIEDWTLEHSHFEVQEILQQAGVAAAAVVTLEEHIKHDPHVKERNIYQWLTYHDGVADPVFRVPWILTQNPSSLDRCGPYVGQHNKYLLADVLGFTAEDIEKLTEEKIVGEVPPVTP